MNESLDSKDGSTQINGEISTTNEPRSSANTDKSTSPLWIPYVCLSLFILLVFFLSFLHYRRQLRIKRNVKLSPADDAENPVSEPAYKWKKVNSSATSKRQAESKTTALPFTDRLKMFSSATNGSVVNDKKGLSFLDKVKAQIAQEESENNHLASGSSANSVSSLLSGVNHKEISSRGEETTKESVEGKGNAEADVDTIDIPKMGTCKSNSIDLSTNENSPRGHLATSTNCNSFPVSPSEQMSEFKQVSNQTDRKSNATKQDIEIVAACEDIAKRKQAKRLGRKTKSSDVFSGESYNEITGESRSSCRSSPDLPPLQETVSRCSSSSNLSPLPPIVERSMRFSKGSSLQSLFEVEECGINGVPHNQTSFRFPPVRNRKSLVDID